MDFFSKLGKKATETYQITKEKAAKVSEELKLKGKISDNKDKIEDLYKEIGEKVYKEIKNDRDVSREEIQSKVDEISSLKADIEKLETEILALKKIKKCDGCGIELEIDAEFCSKCGKKQEKPENIEIKEENEQINAEEAEVIEVNDTQNNEQ